MKTLKAEEVNATAYQNIQHARSAIGEFIEDVYNRHRLHSALDYRSPMEFELASLQLTPRLPTLTYNPNRPVPRLSCLTSGVTPLPRHPIRPRI